MKTILIDINHPAHVHLFRHFITEMKKEGHRVLVTAKETKPILHLLDVYGIAYIRAGQKKDSMLLKYLYELVHLLQVAWVVRKYRVDYGLGVSMVLPILSRFTRMKVVALDDDDMAATPLFARAISYATVVLNPSPLAFEDRGPNRICHPSFHELAYLHPDRFVPDEEVLREAGVQKGERFVIMRFNAFKAHHDGGAAGLTLEQKLEIIQLVKPCGKLFITTERDIEPELKAYQLPVAPEKIHSLMAFATLFIGDSQTMISEAALLGTPAVKLNSFAGRLSIPNEIEQRYGLCYSYRPEQFGEMKERIISLIGHPNLKEEWHRRKLSMLRDKVDLTSFLTRLIYDFPSNGLPPMGN
jgi:uncharacterized protein